MAKTKRAKSRNTPKGAPRASWRGMIRFGLVSFPAEAFNAHAVERDHLALHQLHAECHSRIRYEKTCPIHGRVEQDEIVSGYEASKGRYVEITDEELQAARSQKEKSLTIDTFVAADEIDPFYFDGRMYFLAPEGEQAREPYAVFLKALRAQERCGVGQIVFSGKEQVVLIRPYEEALLMALLNFADEMREPASVIPELPAIRATDKQVRLAEQLIENWTDEKFDFAGYEDNYLKQLQAVIDDKVAGRKTVAPDVEDEPDVINLTEALRRSLSKKPRTNAPRSAKASPRTKRARKKHAS